MFGIIQLLGTIKPPISGAPTGPEFLMNLLTNIIRFALLIAGIYAFINFILAGYSFLSAGGEPKNIANAWQKIWMTIVGLIVIVGSFLLIAVVSFLVYGDPLKILNPVIFGPGK